MDALEIEFEDVKMILSSVEKLADASFGEQEFSTEIGFNSQCKTLNMNRALELILFIILLVEIGFSLEGEGRESEINQINDICLDSCDPSQGENRDLGSGGCCDKKKERFPKVMPREVARLTFEELVETGEVERMWKKVEPEVNKLWDSSGARHVAKTNFETNLKQFIIGLQVYDSRKPIQICNEIDRKTNQASNAVFEVTGKIGGSVAAIPMGTLCYLAEMFGSDTCIARLLDKAMMGSFYLGKYAIGGIFYIITYPLARGFYYYMWRPEADVNFADYEHLADHVVNNMKEFKLNEDCLFCVEEYNLDLTNKDFRSGAILPCCGQVIHEKCFDKWFEDPHTNKDECLYCRGRITWD